MKHRSTPTSTVLLFAAIACGPPRLGSADGDSSEVGSDTTDSGVTSSDPSETSTTDPTTTGLIPPSGDVIPENCDPWSQDCPDGEKCVPYASTGGTWDANKCVPIMGDQAPGEPCWYGGVVAATDDCDASSACFNVTEIDGELLGTCLAFCTGTPDKPGCPEGSSCRLSGDGTLTLCFPTCDPLVQDCEPGQACYWANAEFNCVFTTQDIPAGEPCGFINDCAAGLTCTTAEVIPECEGPACCTPFCDLELGDSQCQSMPGTLCVPFFEGQALPGYELVGICILP